MRAVILAFLSIAGLSIVSAMPAQAQTDYPVCLRAFGRDSYVECAYTSIAQCKMSASGRAAECYRDPFYPAYSEAPVRPRYKRHRAHRHH